MPLEVIILAAGKGTRMYSSLPKVLHEVGGKSLLAHVIATAKDLNARRIHVVYGHGGETVPQVFAGSNVNWVLQDKQLGTGHAVQQAMPYIKSDASVLVLYGDVPLIDAGTLQHLAACAHEGKVALLTAELEQPGSYGRILRNGVGEVAGIVETKDAKLKELAIKEINTGFMAIPANRLGGWLKKLSNNNAQGEYYLTDIIAMAVADGVKVTAFQPKATAEIMGINSKQELAQMERIYQSKQAQALMEQGVTLRDPARLDVRGELTVGRDVEIDVNVIFEGQVTLGDGVKIGPNNIIRNATIGAGTTILANCIIEDAVIGDQCAIGPFSRFRPEVHLADQVKIGNFVEIKKSEVGQGSKINHLSYVGDTTVGKTVNIGAGTITCNYDGAYKHRTLIGDNAFIGSNTQLVAPVSVGQGATIGAGSTITKDVPNDELALSRSKQVTVKGWRRPKKAPKGE